MGMTGAGHRTSTRETKMDYADHAKQLVKLVRARTTTQDEAVALITQALKCAHTGGEVDGFKDAYESGMRAFDAATHPQGYDPTKVIGGPQTEAVERLSKAGA